MEVNYRNGGKWTESRYRSFIVSVLRSGMRRWPPKWVALQEACSGTKVNPKTGRFAKHYLCASCWLEYPVKDVQVDHIEPVVPRGGFESFDKFIENLYCEDDNLQVLCKECHTMKSWKERYE